MKCIRSFVVITAMQSCFVPKLSACKLNFKKSSQILVSQNHTRTRLPPSLSLTGPSQPAAFFTTLIFQLPTHVLCDSSTVSSLTVIPKSRDFPAEREPCGWATDGWRVTAHGQGRWVAVRVWRHSIRWGWATFRQARCATGSLSLTMLSQPAFPRYNWYDCYWWIMFVAISVYVEFDEFLFSDNPEFAFHS